MEAKEYKKLMAEHYDLVSSEVDGPELEFWLRLAAEADGPILELGSGTGRVLVPLLERGLDITGIDTSPDMMERCRAKCSRKGLRAVVHHQAMEEFDLPRRFGLVILASCGLGLLIHDQDVCRMLGRVMTHLRPGGMFVFEIEPVPTAPKHDANKWSGGWLRGPGDTVVASRRVVNYHPDTHVWENLTIFEKFTRGRLTETEADERVGRYYTVDEVVQWLQTAGFVDIRASDWLSDEPLRKDSTVVSFRCRKPA